MQAHIRQEVTSLAMCIKLVLTKFQPQIERITNSNPGVIKTYWPHGFENGDTVRIVLVRGMTGLNRNEYAVLKLDDYFFQINVDTSAMPEYAGKGEARKVMGFTSFSKDLVL